MAAFVRKAAFLTPAWLPTPQGTCMEPLTSPGMRTSCRSPAASGFTNSFTALHRRRAGVQSHASIPREISYGTVPDGGVYQKRTVLKLSRTNGVWTYTDLYDFTGGSDGYGSVGSVILNAGGNI